jgi:hypothetical protein
MGAVVTAAAAAAAVDMLIRCVIHGTVPRPQQWHLVVFVSAWRRSSLGYAVHDIWVGACHACTVQLAVCAAAP